MTELSASDAAYFLRDDERICESTSTYADNGIGYRCFHKKKKIYIYFFLNKKNSFHNDISPHFKFLFSNESLDFCDF